MENAKYEAVRDSKHHAIDIFPASSARPHFHAQVEIVLVYKGKFTATVNGQTEILGKGDICVSGSYDVHSYTTAGQNATVVLSPLQYMQRFFRTVKGNVVSEHFLHDPKLFRALDSLVRLYLDNGQAHNDLFDEGWTNAVMGLLYGPLAFVPAVRDGKVETVREVLEYIRMHYSEDLSLPGLSKRFGYSPYHFSRLFNSLTAVGLKQYINSVRLEAAIDKLMRGESAESAALSSGFCSMRSFYRDFSAVYGVPPQEYVKKLSPR